VKRSRTFALRPLVRPSVGLAALLAALAFAASSPTEAGTDEWHALLGYSHRDRPIRVHRFGDFSSPRKILVVGCIHGDECQGVKITRRLARGARPRRIDLWVVHHLNPDGYVLGVRQNGRGVDLNRNFGSEWIPIGQRWDPQYSGPRPWSERETRLARRLILRVRPDVTIWYHQPQALVRAWGQSRRMARRYARLAGEPYRSIRWPHGTAPNWQNHRFQGIASFVVELAAGRLSDAAARRHANAVRRLLPTS
jgi:murein peptide amidase A